MKPAEGLFVAAPHEEEWPCEVAYATREEAAAHAVEDLELEPDQPFCTGRLHKLNLNDIGFFDAEWIIDDACEKVADEFGPEAAETFLQEKKIPQKAKDELEEVLQTAFIRWIHKHDLDLRYWQVDDMERHPPTSVP